MNKTPIPGFEELTPKDQMDIRQVAATMAVENMPLSESDIESLVAFKKGARDLVEEIDAIAAAETQQQ